MKRILILGGGASGLAAAIAAAQTGRSRVQVTVLERNLRLGKKLLATGNGRCNLDNAAAGPEQYFTAEPAALKPLLAAVSAADPLDWFGQMGLLTREDEAGRIYPYSNQAADVVNLLLRQLDALGVEQRTGCTVQELTQKKGGYLVRFETEAGQSETLYADAVICALGGSAGPQFGTDGFGPEFARRCGGRSEPLYPCLVPLNCSKSQIRGLSGIRVRASAALLDGTAELARETGEVQFTDYGLSGICIMQLSCLLAPGRRPRRPAVLLDLFPQWTEEQLTEFLTRRAAGLPDCTAQDALLGLVHPKVGLAVWTAAGCGSPTAPLSRLSPQTWALLAHAFKHWRFDGLSPCGWKQAQTTGGGLSLTELEPDSFQFRGCPGLYFVGETLDCAGTCGGFNLHWAFGSGLVAGRHAAWIRRG